jgi:hypothetical protein
MNLIFRILLAPVKVVYFVLCLLVYALLNFFITMPLYLICEREKSESISEVFEKIMDSADGFFNFCCPNKGY